MFEQTYANDPVVLGEGPMANSIQGGHAALVEGIPFPRWVVAIESTTDQGPRSGVVVDLVHQAVGRWFLVAPGDALVHAASCGIRMGSRHLCIPTIYRLDGGHLDHDLQIGMIAPIVDHLTEHWEHRDGPMPEGTGRDAQMAGGEDEGDPGQAAIDRRALAMLADLHAGATATENHEGDWTMRTANQHDDDEDDVPVDVQGSELRTHPGSAGHQLAHWGLAVWTSRSTLSITPAGRGLASSHGYPAGPAKGRWSEDVEIGGKPDVLVVEHLIEEPRELEVPCDGTLHVDRKHDGWGNGGKVNLRFDHQMEGVVLEMSTARALIEQLSPALIKGAVSKVRVEAPDHWSSGRRVEQAVISIGEGAVIVETTPSRGEARYKIILDATKARLLRAILRESVKRNGEGGALEDVEIWKTTREALYGEVDWA